MSYGPFPYGRVLSPSSPAELAAAAKPAPAVAAKISTIME
jgi:hypothetical protein